MAEQSKRDDWLSQDDAALLAECSVDRFRSSGPGGQHANKTSSAVRLRHRPTGLIAVAEEERSQHANKAKAIRRLRMAIALNVREPIGASWESPAVFGQYVTKTGRIEVSKRNPVYPAIVAVVLDVVAARNGRLREAAAKLEVGTAQLSRFVVSDGKVLDAVNRTRQAAGLRKLSPR
ncbi:MAG: peptide chain release factor-like protein [Phycisphaerae bacterium]|nr:peptide chain release factor-like protein [Phycisphaerae bacterium]